jgi:hypothetical protein
VGVITFTFLPERMSVSAQADYLSLSVNTDNLSDYFSPYDESTNLKDKIYYTNTQGQQQYVDNSWQAAVLPWNWQMTHDDYSVRVKTAITDGVAVV